MLKTIWHLFYIELIILLRRSQEWLYPLGFFLIVLSLFPLAFSADPVFLQKYVPGCIWIAALLASFLSVQTLFASDLEDGALEQLLLSPLPLTSLIYPKLIALWLVTELPLILLMPLTALLFHLSFSTMLILSLSLLLGTPILTLIGGLGVALTLGLRQQGIFLGLLILPLVTPVLIFGVGIVQQFQAGFDITAPLALLAGLLVLAITLLPFAIACTVKTVIDS